MSCYQFNLHILRNTHRTEYCCPEAGRYFKGENDTKILKESGIKSPKMLKDMFVCLGNSIEWDENTIRK
ncbi:11429_t:CDS:2 [Entrophospora sp. SA101]|nr:11429_t:CDS:2 [Entrophospora sp. SA101]